ncbi:MAG: hypothetical protein UT84_C0001G0073 [Candidatus Curtissbacteria bacterium GW2011_GWA1_40_16]|uniref:RmlD-like substrate binding domain-containing protein n=1 Tax=Candidatus Curtissbacteria bacterium GW2011_GWA1_40_16 TaxID=1618405 RepID=A0A0G0RFZ2_9BACT|nr:MAG: hypothetical protein UT84_C0001G0073 [Candidatus Curtissbacteria bacterium GW2011_GWA1_40_16]
MRIFLSGSTSFLGSKFLALYSDSFEIFAFSKNDPETQLDLLDFEKLKKEYLNYKPDVIIHLAADINYNSENSKNINIEMSKNIISVAQLTNTPIVFMSSESVYGGKENEGDYKEEDPYKARSPYAQSKVEVEKLIINSGLNYLILRGHRLVGINKNYKKQKQFPDTLKSLINHKAVHLDPNKLFNPTLINHVCTVFVHYIEKDLGKKIILNIGVDEVKTYFDFIFDVAKILNLDTSLIKHDGEEKGWSANSTLNLNKIHELKYPTLTYSDLLKIIAEDYFS